MIAQAAARGPLHVLLNSAGGQYIFLGAAAYGLFPEQVQKLLGPIIRELGGVSGYLEHERQGTVSTTSSGSSSPIIIHTSGPSHVGSNGRSTMTSTIVYAVAGAGACWVGYVVCVQTFPEVVSQMLPVTKSVFEHATQTLSLGLLKVKKVLEDKILGLSKQQDELAQKQDETHKSVTHIKGELGEARIDLNFLKATLERCEGTLGDTQGLQEYTLRGVRLLIRGIAGFVPEDSSFMSELSQYMEEGDGVVADELPSPPPQLATPRPSLPGMSLAGHTPPSRVFITPKRTISAPCTMGSGSTTSTSASTSSFPSISPIPSDDSASQGRHAINDIRALLGH